MTRQNINSHEGSKYIRIIHSCSTENSVAVDVYAVLKAFDVTCPARQHCIKKLLCAGLRGKGSQLDDLKGAMAALNRAIDLQELEENTSDDSRVFMDVRKLSPEYDPKEYE